MTLNAHVNYPSTRTYVLKLHRDAAPADGQMFGRLESLASGEHFDFRTGAELLARLVEDLAPAESAPQTTQDSTDPESDALRWP